MDPLTAIALISAACSIASYLKAYNRDVTLPNILEFLPRVDTGGQAALSSSQAELTSESGLQLIHFLVINPDLLEELTQHTKNSEKDYINCLRRAKRSQERDRCDRIAERSICETLNRIMDRNDGRLPTEFLIRLWASYNCVRY